MKLKTLLISFVLAALLLPMAVACAKSDSETKGDPDENQSNSVQTGNVDPESSETVKMKFFKAGRSTCIVIRTSNGVVMIDMASDDDADVEKIQNYLAEKKITTVDHLIITNFSKKHIGGAPALLTDGSVTYKNVYLPNYTKSSGTYQKFQNALQSAGLNHPITVSDQSTEIRLGDVVLNLYAPHKTYTVGSEVSDEGNSLAVTMTYRNNSFLMTSRIDGERVTELISDLDGKTFDLITVPNYGIYSSTYDSLFTAVKSKFAIAICSNNAAKDQMHTETLSALKNAGTTVFATRDGSVEVHMDGTNVSVNGTPIELP